MPPCAGTYYEKEAQGGTETFTATATGVVEYAPPFL